MNWNPKLLIDVFMAKNNHIYNKSIHNSEYCFTNIQIKEILRHVEENVKEVFDSDSLNLENQNILLRQKMLQNIVILVLILLSGSNTQSIFNLRQCWKISNTNQNNSYEFSDYECMEGLEYFTGYKNIRIIQRHRVMTCIEKL